MCDISLSIIKNDPYSYHMDEKLRYLEPINLGSCNIESLSSYITRLANSHYLKTRVFIHYLVKDLKNHSYDTTVRGSPRLWYSVNGVDQRAIDISNTLNTNFTHDFRRLTFLPIASAIEVRAHGLLSQNMKWCITCWKERVNNNLPVYVPLSWTAKLYTVCTQHNCKLEHTCPHCRAEQKMLPFLPSLLHCQKCGHELIDDETEPVTLTNTKNNQELWFSKNIEDLIQKTSGRNYFIESPSIPDLLHSIIRKHWHNDIGNFSLRLGFANREAVSHWLSGKKQPSFYNIMKMSYLLQIPLFEILNSSISPLFIDSSIIDYKPVKDGHYKRLRTKQEINDITRIVKKVLHDMRQGKNHMSVTQLSLKLDCNLWFLRNRYKTEYDEIKQLYSKHTESNQKKYNDEILCKISDACKDMIDKNIYPTERKLKEDYSLPVRYVRRKSAKEHLIKYQTLYKSRT